MMFRDLFIAALLIFGAALSASAREDARTIATDLDGQYDKIFDAHDASGLTGFYSSDATILPPTAAAISGSDNILKFWQTVLRTPWSRHKFEVVSAKQISESLILATARWSADLTTDSGKVVPFHGDAVQIFEKAGAGWQIRSVSWNVLK